MKRTASFLDSLLDEELLHVLRSLSRFPSRRNWTAYIPCHDAMVALHPNNVLCNVARATFTGVCTSGAGSTKMGTICLPPAHLTRWLQLAGESIVFMRLSQLQLPDRQDRARFLQTLHSQCAALRNLDVSGYREEEGEFISAVLRATSGRLHKLSISYRHSSDVAVHCAGLQNLIFVGGPCDLSAVLAALGRSLQSLTMDELRDEIIPQLRQVRDLCPALTRIAFYGIPNHAYEPYAELLASYGAQLKNATLNRMSFELINMVVAACPNARFHIDLDPVCANAKKLLFLGPAVDELRVSACTSHDLEALAMSAPKCFRVEKMDLCVHQESSEVGAIAARHALTNKAVLSHLYFEMRNGIAADALLEIGVHGGTLRVFFFNGDLQGLREKSALEAVVRGCPMLEDVDIHWNFSIRDLDDHEDILEYVIGSFLQCRKLRELCVSDFTFESNLTRMPRIESMCKVIRHNRGLGTSVIVQNEVYLA